MWWCIKLFSKVTIFQLSNKWHWVFFGVFLFFFKIQYSRNPGMKIGLLCLEIGQFIKSITFDSNFISAQRVMRLWCFTLWCTGKMGFYLTLSSSAQFCITNSLYLPFQSEYIVFGFWMMDLFGYLLTVFYGKHWHGQHNRWQVVFKFALSSRW